MRIIVNLQASTCMNVLSLKPVSLLITIQSADLIN